MEGFWNWFWFVMGVQGLLCLSFEPWEQTKMRMSTTRWIVLTFTSIMGYLFLTARGLNMLFGGG